MLKLEGQKSGIECELAFNTILTPLTSAKAIAKGIEQPD